MLLPFFRFRNYRCAFDLDASIQGKTTSSESASCRIRGLHKFLVYAVKRGPLTDIKQHNLAAHNILKTQVKMPKDKADILQGLFALGLDTTADQDATSRGNTDLPCQVYDVAHADRLRKGSVQGCILRRCIVFDWITGGLQSHPMGNGGDEYEASALGVKFHFAPS